jgi:predicted transcriptional regulator
MSIEFHRSPESSGRMSLEAQKERLRQLEGQMDEINREIVVMQTARANRREHAFTEDERTQNLTVDELARKIDHLRDNLAELEERFMAPELDEARAPWEKRTERILGKGVASGRNLRALSRDEAQTLVVPKAKLEQPKE